MNEILHSIRSDLKGNSDETTRNTAQRFFKEKEVLDYVTKYKKIMPRTALRYAIELMPKELRAEAMKK
jgi:hypothetical protein